MTAPIPAYRDLGHTRARDSSAIEEALHALKEKTPVKGRLLQEAPAAFEGVVELQVSKNAYRYNAEVKMRIDRKEAVRVVKSMILHSGEPGLLITPYVSKEMADYCREVDLEFIDHCGNAYLKMPELFVYVTGERRRTTSPTIRQGRGLNASALRVHFVLLASPALVQSPYRDIAAKAGVSVGTVSDAMEDLERRGLLLQAGNRRGRRVLEYDLLFREWISTYPVALRTKLKSKRYSASDPDWWTTTKGLDNAMWGGEVAAAELTHYLKPATQTLYADPVQGRAFLRDLIAVHRMRADPQGPVEILERFWFLSPGQTHPHVVPPLLVYADLLASHDARNIEAAELIKERYIDPSFRLA